MPSKKDIALRERDEALARAAAADKVVAEAQQQLELAQAMEAKRESAHVEQLVRLQEERTSLVQAKEQAEEKMREAQLEAERLLEDLGVNPTEGVVRISLAHYNTVDEVERLGKALDEALRGRAGDGRE